MDSLDIWNVMLNFRIKTGGWGWVEWGNVSRKIKGIFSSWVRFLQALNREVSTCKNKTDKVPFLTIIQMVLLFNKEYPDLNEN